MSAIEDLGRHAKAVAGLGIEPPVVERAILELAAGLAAVVERVEALEVGALEEVLGEDEAVRDVSDRGEGSG